MCFALLQGNLEAEQAEARKREKAERKKKQEEERKQAEEEAAAAKARPCSYLLCYVAWEALCLKIIGLVRSALCTYLCCALLCGDSCSVQWGSAAADCLLSGHRHHPP